MLSLINIIVTLVIVLFMLLVGVADGVFSGGVLVLLLFGYFRDKPIDSGRK